MYYESPSYSSPGLPVPNPCLSFWLQGTRSSPLLGHRTTESLPASAEVAIIGSGLSGVATAYFLLTGPNPPESVVILEAREACDGATGRNGGHCRPFAFQGYYEYKQIFGKEQALKIIQLEADNLRLLASLIEKEKIECDFWLGESFDTALDQANADAALRSYEEFKADGGPLDEIVELITDSSEAKRVTRMHNAVLTASFPTASLWPYKLVLHLLQLCISRYGLNLQTSTPVTSISVQPTSASDSTNSDAKWVLSTPRGDLIAHKVIHATNAFAATLLPEFLGHIVPGQGQCAAIVPTKAYSGKGMMERTCAYTWANGNYDYLVQRPKDGIIILGGGKGSISDPSRIVGQTDDRIKQKEITEYLRGSMGLHFIGWDGDGEGEGEVMGEGLLYDWTGIMGYTRDNIPFVGPVEGKPNTYLNAGHCGHGMARIISCAKGLAALISISSEAGGSWADTGLPECFRPSKERLERKKRTDTVG